MLLFMSGWFRLKGSHQPSAPPSGRAGLMTRDTKAELDTFTRAYIECALWSTNDESNDQGGEPLDQNYSTNDLEPETLARMVEDCAEFQRQAGEAIVPDLKRAGYDFWLTRNGHRVGFWDGDWEETIGEQLTKLSEGFGEFDLYVTDEGMVAGYPLHRLWAAQPGSQS